MTLARLLHYAAGPHGLLGEQNGAEARTVARLVGEGLLERRARVVRLPADDPLGHWEWLGGPRPEREAEIVSYHLTEAGRVVWLAG